MWKICFASQCVQLTAEIPTLVNRETPETVTLAQFHPTVERSVASALVCAVVMLRASGLLVRSGHPASRDSRRFSSAQDAMDRVAELVKSALDKGGQPYHLGRPLRFYSVAAVLHRLSSTCCCFGTGFAQGACRYSAYPMSSRFAQSKKMYSMTL